MGFVTHPQGDVSVSDVSIARVPEYECAMVYERKIEIPSSLPLWSFFSSENLPNYDALPDVQYYSARDELFAEYETLQNAIANGDVDFILSKARERSQETDTAFYLEPGTTESKLRVSLQPSAE